MSPLRSMLQRGAFLLLLVSGLMSCYRNPKPNGLMEAELMIDVLTDIHLIQAATDITVPDTAGFFMVHDTALTAVLDHYNLRKSQLDSSMNYYLTDLDAMDALYDQVIDRLNHLESRTIQERSR